MYFLVKTLVSGLIVAGASEIAKRMNWLGALLISLPVMSILSLSWLYRDTGDIKKVTALSRGIFLSLVPSLLFFIILPALLKAGWRYVPALVLSCVAIFAAYWIYVFALSRFGVRI